MSRAARALRRASDGLADILRGARGHFVEIHDPARLRAARLLLTLLWGAAAACALLA